MLKNPPDGYHTLTRRPSSRMHMRRSREPTDQFSGDRTGRILDNQGNQWWISTHIEDVSEEEIRRRMTETRG